MSLSSSDDRIANNSSPKFILTKISNLTALSNLLPSNSQAFLAGTPRKFCHRDHSTNNKNVQREPVYAPCMGPATVDCGFLLYSNWEHKIWLICKQEAIVQAVPLCTVMQILMTY